MTSSHCEFVGSGPFLYLYSTSDFQAMLEESIGIGPDVGLVSVNASVKTLLAIRPQGHATDVLVAAFVVMSKLPPMNVVPGLRSAFMMTGVHVSFTSVVVLFWPSSCLGSLDLT